MPIKEVIIIKFKTMDDYKYEYIDTATTTQVKTGRGFLKSITVGTKAAGAIYVRDGVDNADPLIGVLKSDIAEGTYDFNCTFANGLIILTDAATKITVTYR
jgi:hypothetical protein